MGSPGMKSGPQRRITVLRVYKIEGSTVTRYSLGSTSGTVTVTGFKGFSSYILKRKLHSPPHELKKSSELHSQKTGRGRRARALSGNSPKRALDGGHRINQALLNNIFSPGIGLVYGGRGCRVPCQCPQAWKNFTSYLVSYRRLQAKPRLENACSHLSLH